MGSRDTPLPDVVFDRDWLEWELQKFEEAGSQPPQYEIRLETEGP